MEVSFGQKIAELRKQKGWTQALFGEKIGYHGRHISRWERDLSRPSVKAVKRISEVLGVDFDELLGGRQPLPEAEEVMRRRIQQLQDLEPEDQAVIDRMLALMSTQKRMAQLLHR